MRPGEIVVGLGEADMKNLLAEMTIDNRALRLALAKYMDTYGLHPDYAPPSPSSPAEMPPAPAEEGGQELGHPGPGE